MKSRSMHCVPEKGQRKQCAGPQEAAPTKPQCLAAAKKPRRRRIDVAHPKKGPRQRKQCHAAPKGCKETRASIHLGPAFQKNSFSNKKKGPHPRHDSNSAFRRLIAAFFC